MTATDELRRMLDERGVEWRQSVNTIGCVFTRWYSPLFSDEVVAMENGDGELELFSHLMTPEQAIEATLGRGTCHDSAGEQMAFFSCSACGATIERKHPRFCFACGRKVVDA